MKSQSFKRIGIIIALIIIVTVIIQGLNLYNHYQNSLRVYKANIQDCLDESIEEYYAELAKTEVHSYQTEEELIISGSLDGRDSTEMARTVKVFQQFSGNKMITENISEVTKDLLLNNKDTTIIIYDTIRTGKGEVKNVDHLKVISGLSADDSLFDMRSLASKIIISFKSDTLDRKKLEKLLLDRLEQRKLEPTIFIQQLTKQQEVDDSLDNAYSFSTLAASTYLPPDQKIKLYYTNAPFRVLKIGAIEISFSILFVIVIISVLIYLYNIIKNQKAISEIKNDLINNITHEFKTPIATISTAIEGIQHFNEEEDKEKTKKYLNISTQQLSKLNLMVEKLLETATLDQGSLKLSKENVNLNQLLEQLIYKFKTLDPTKSIQLVLPENEVILEADKFHLENAVSNLIDNAIKYGGDQISIQLSGKPHFSLIVTDNGKGIASQHLHKLFDQFYRVPTGNIHNVKGFGIGLYYTKKIIEQHGGSIAVVSKNGRTEFKIVIA